MAKAKSAPEGAEPEQIETAAEDAPAVLDRNRIDFNDPTLTGAEAVARNLAAQTEE